jgi:hypothetical protein
MKYRGGSFVGQMNTLKEIYASTCKWVQQVHARHAARLPAGRHELAAYLLLDEAKALHVAPKLGCASGRLKPPGKALTKSFNTGKFFTSWLRERAIDTVLENSGVNIAENRWRFWYAAPMIDCEAIIAEHRIAKACQTELLALCRNQHTATSTGLPNEQHREA